MLRWMVPALAAMLTVSAAVAADLPATPKRRAAAPPQEPPQVYVETDPDALISCGLWHWQLHPQPAGHTAAAGIEHAAGLLRPPLGLRLSGPVLRRTAGRLFLATALRLRHLRLLLISRAGSPEPRASALPCGCRAASRSVCITASASTTIATA